MENNSDSANGILRRLMPTLHAVWDMECGPSAKDREERALLEHAARILPSVASVVFAQDDATIVAANKLGWPDNDAWAQVPDLLVPLRSERRETLHTQALRFLLDPGEVHGLGGLLLDALMSDLHQRDILTEQARECLCNGSCIVTAEAESAVSAAQLNRKRRTDLRLDASQGSVAVALVIENKVDDQAQSGQLKDYDRILEQFRTSRGPETITARVLLSVTGEEAYEWPSITWLDVAADFARSVERENLPIKGVAFVRMWCSSVIHGIYELPAQIPVARADRATTATYLRRRYKIS